MSYALVLEAHFAGAEAHLDSALLPASTSTLLTCSMSLKSSGRSSRCASASMAAAEAPDQGRDA